MSCHFLYTRDNTIIMTFLNNMHTIIVNCHISHVPLKKSNQIKFHPLFVRLNNIASHKLHLKKTCILHVHLIMSSMKIHKIDNKCDFFRKILSDKRKRVLRTLIKSQPIILKFHSSLNYKSNDMHSNSQCVCVFFCHH